MQLQNGLTPSVPYFSQNTATTGVNTHSAVQAKTEQESPHSQSFTRVLESIDTNARRQGQPPAGKSVCLTARHKDTPEAS